MKCGCLEVEVSEESMKAIAVCKECKEKEDGTSLMQHVGEECKYPMFR